MKNLNLTFPQRVAIMNYLSPIDAPLGELRALGRVLDAVRFTDHEQQELKLSPPNAEGKQAVTAPRPSFGELCAQIEDADAAVWVAEIEGRPKQSMANLAWIDHVLPQLKATSATPKKGGK